jgi:hypothetical protein
VANGDNKFGIITGNLSKRKNVFQKMLCFSENGDELSGDNWRVNCIVLFSCSAPSAPPTNIKLTAVSNSVVNVQFKVLRFDFALT